MRNRLLVLIKGSREVYPIAPPFACDSRKHVVVFIPYTAQEKMRARPGKTGHFQTVRRDSLRTITMKKRVIK